MLSGALFVVVAYVSLAFAVPTFEGLASRASIGSLVPGLSYLEAMGPVREGAQWTTPNFMTIHATRGRGLPGNATIGQTSNPAMFYINQGQLWQYTNETYIFPVNVHNSSATSPLPLQLSTAHSKEGIKGGYWRWQGSQLYYDLGSKTNNGLFYSCTDRGWYGVFMQLDPQPTPPACRIVTLHGFMREQYDS